MKLALAGDTMLGRGVAQRLQEVAPEQLFADEVVAAAHEADLFVLNLECAVSARGTRWPDPHKPFFFRAPPVATRTLQHLGVDCVSLANNHALDFGAEALVDTLRHLDEAGIAHVGAGPSTAAARAPVRLQAADAIVDVIAATDHPQDFAAGPDRPGVAFADLRHEVPAWLIDSVAEAEADIVLVVPHWGPNMVREPVPHVRRAAAELLAAGATLIAGHSAHVFHGIQGPVLYDLGDFIDDYATDPVLRNDRGLLFLVTLDGRRLRRIEAVPLALDFCFTRLADAGEADWIAARFRQACADLGTDVKEQNSRLVVDCPP